MVTVTIVAIYFLIGAVIVIPGLDDLSFVQMLSSIVLWPIVVIVTIYAIIKTMKE